jgi:hypothetical protein
VHQLPAHSRVDAEGGNPQFAGVQAQFEKSSGGALRF